MEKGLGLNELAKRADIQPAQLSRLERGHQLSAHAATLRKIAKALGIKVAKLMQVQAWTTKDVANVLEEAGVSIGPGAVEQSIINDPSISADRKKWLLECVSVARLSGKPD